MSYWACGGAANALDCKSSGATLRRCKSYRAHHAKRGGGPLSGPTCINMFYIYILFSEKDKQLYIGYTPDLKVRIEKHQKGFVTATKFRRPLKLIYYESYLEKIDAKRREIFLKGGKGHNELKIQLKEVLQKLMYKNL